MLRLPQACWLLTHYCAVAGLVGGVAYAGSGLQAGAVVDLFSVANKSLRVACKLN